MYICCCSIQTLKQPVWVSVIVLSLFTNLIGTSLEIGTALESIFKCALNVKLLDLT